MDADKVKKREFYTEDAEDTDKTKMLISFANELAKEINPLSLRSAKSLEIRFSFFAPAQIGKCFLFFG